MLTRIASAFVVVAVTALSTVIVPPATLGKKDRSGLTVHEWGTFTTVAGSDGRAIEWLPLGGPTDLPCFVEHFRNNPYIKLLPEEGLPLNYETARSSLPGTVRMETPVLYFYAAREMSARVRVEFPQGLLTEWYPHANVTQPVVSSMRLRYPNHVSVIEWPDVTISPRALPTFPTGNRNSHYYAARATDAAPLLVKGQPEKFLFYRGVAGFDVRLSAVSLGSGDIRIANTGPDELPAVVLFENRGGALGYRIHGALPGEVTLAAPSLNGNLAALRVELEKMLVDAGLYAKEAAAMVETWRDSWFEEGTRVFYVVSSRVVDAILPLSINPKPDHVARVFVGRMEVITPAIERTVERAITRNDPTVLARYSRFLGPITDRILAKGTDADGRARIAALTNSIFASYVRRASSCD